MMLTLDLPSMCGIMARPANRLIRVRDAPQFNDLLHLILEPVVVRIYAGEGEAEVRNFQDQGVELMRGTYELMLTANRDCHLLSRNHVNVSVAALAEILHGMGARLCRVSFFGMKWALSSAKSIIDHYIGRYRDQMGSSVPKGMNSFDYEFRFDTDGVILLRFSEAQHLSHKYVQGRVHEMCEMEGFGFVRLNSNIDGRIS